MRVWSFISGCWVDRGLITERCPNCESAWTGGHPDPESRNFCLVCSDKSGTITGWTWGFLVDPFHWIAHAIVDRNFKNDQDQLSH